MEFHRPSQVPPEADRSDARLSAAAAALTASSTRRSPPPLPDSGRQLAEATSAPALTASSTRRSPPPLPDSGRQLAEATSAPGLTASRPLPDSRRQLAQATSAPALTTSPTGVSPPPRPLADSSRRLAQDTSSRAPALVIQSRGHASPSSPWPLLRGSRLVRSAAEPPALDEAVDEPPQAQRRRSFKNTDEPPQKQQRTPQKGVEPEQCRIEDRPKETKVNVHRGAPFPRCQICGRRVLTYYYKCCGQATCKDCQRACNCRFKTRLDVPRVKTGGGDLRASLVDGVNLDVYISIYTFIYTLLKYTPLSFSVERVNLDVYIPTAIFSNGYIFNGYIFNGRISLYKPPLPSFF
ncbi:uncharacterized protein [Aegilops tauschii subsp. strangulata]|uniref:uncharacterized protein isoform X3 n=1 Tax=Aegilops tauschii subsp. strangulata TaxID=200361 RepID=UPI003CC8C1DA